MLDIIILIHLWAFQVGLPYWPVYPIPPRPDIPLELRTTPTRIRK